jgi:AraC-type DNA-binding domain-containing proteins
MEPREIIKYPGVHGVSLTDKNSPESFHSHWHNAAEFTVALKDNCRYRVGEKPYTLNRGDILLIWPRELHEIIHVPKNGSIFIQFSSTLLENNLDLISMSRFFTEYHHIKAENEPLLASRIAGKLHEIREILSSDISFAETKCKLCIYDIVLQVGEYVIKNKKEQIDSLDYSDISWKHIHEACSYIAEHSADNLTETEVASHVGLSPYYFSRLFKEYMQTTFPAYVSGIRVRSAIRLLSDDSLTITDTAFMSGFQSTTAFNKVFRDITGCSPREYRKLHLQSGK